MSAPPSLVIRTFAERAEGMGHLIARAGEAPRLVAFDDTVGCAMDTALSALEWSVSIGLLRDDDAVHAAQLTSEVSIAVVERRAETMRQYLYFGPRLDALGDLHDGRVLLDEPGVKSIEFGGRAPALAHFLRATGGTTGLLAMLGRRAPEIRHLRRWLGAILHQLEQPAPMLGGWFAATAAGALFATLDDDQTAWRYIEVAMES
jgi:hypothetical protein